MDTQIYFRMRAIKDAKGNWQADDAGGWRFLPVPTGPGKKPDWMSEAIGRAKNGKGGFQYRLVVAGKRRWSKMFSTIEAAQRAAGGWIDARSSVDSSTGGLTLVDAVHKYIAKKSGKAPRTLSNYTHILNEFVENVPRSIRFVRQVDEDILQGFQRHLKSQGAAPKTILNKVMVVCFMLKAAGVANPSKMIDLPKIDDDIVEPYTSDDLKALFAAMDVNGGDEETIHYRFFLDTACREQEVQHAQWNDIDWKKNEYIVRSKTWKDANGIERKFTTKNHKTRRVPLTRELVDMLKKRKEAASTKWIFPNSDGQPDGHMLRKFKAIAKRANLNCGDCTTTIREGQYEKRHDLEVSCLTRPVCEKHYLHRLRKTRATFWHENGVSLRTIQHWLSHESLETTMKYLGVQDSQKLQEEINKPMYEMA